MRENLGDRERERERERSRELEREQRGRLDRLQFLSTST